MWHGKIWDRFQIEVSTAKAVLMWVCQRFVRYVWITSSQKIIVSLIISKRLRVLLGVLLEVHMCYICCCSLFDKVTRKWYHISLTIRRVIAGGTWQNQRTNILTLGPLWQSPLQYPLIPNHRKLTNMEAWNLLQWWTNKCATAFKVLLLNSWFDLGHLLAPTTSSPWSFDDSSEDPRFIDDEHLIHSRVPIMCPYWLTTPSNNDHPHSFGDSNQWQVGYCLNSWCPYWKQSSSMIAGQVVSGFPPKQPAAVKCRCGFELWSHASWFSGGWTNLVKNIACQPTNHLFKYWGSQMMYKTTKQFWCSVVFLLPAVAGFEQPTWDISKTLLRLMSTLVGCSLDEMECIQCIVWGWKISVHTVFWTYNVNTHEQMSSERLPFFFPCLPSPEVHQLQADIFPLIT